MHERLFVPNNDLDQDGAKFRCDLSQCGACVGSPVKHTVKN